MNYKTAYFAVFIVAMTILSTWPMTAKSENALSSNPEELKELILQTIRDNPEIVMEALQILQERDEAEKQARAQNALTTYRPVLEKDPGTPVGGNPNGDITIVEFFDYRCGYCKRVHPAIKTLLEQDQSIRWVYKEFPILGAESLLGAKAALAVWEIEPAKYSDFHGKIMETRGGITLDWLLGVGSELGIDSEQLKSTMESDTVRGSIQRNLELAQALGISGTPAFIIGDRIVPGAISLEQFQALVKEARAG